MILADDEKGRRAALAKILPMQRQDFVELFETMDGLPVTIRLLDPPLHEFLPHDATPTWRRSPRTLGVDRRRDRARASRSCTRPTRCSAIAAAACGITYPEIYEMQVRAIIEAAVEVRRRPARRVIPEIMIPLVAHQVEELDLMKAVIDRVAEEVHASRPAQKLDYLVGTMIELPRAALRGRRDRRDGRVLLASAPTT